MTTLTRRSRHGEDRGEITVEPSSVPGLYLWPTEDECELCLEEYGVTPQDCPHPVGHSWQVVCQAGVVVQWLSWTREDAERLAGLYGTTGIDFTLALEQLVEACADPDTRQRADAALHQMWQHPVDTTRDPQGRL